MIEAQLADGTTLQFPEGTDPEIIQQTVKRVIAQGTQSTAEKPEQSFGDKANAWAQNISQGMTGGFGDEIGMAIAKSVPAYGAARGVNAIANLVGMGNENPPDYEAYKAKVDASKGKIMAPMMDYNAENPLTAGALQAAGGIATGVAGGKLLSSAAPKVGSALAQFAKAHPYLAAAGLGTSGGAVHGAGTGDQTAYGRVGNSAIEALGGLIGGPVATGVVREVVGPVVGKVAGSAIERFAKMGHPTPPVVSTAAPLAPVPTPTPGLISNITNKSLNPPAVAPSSPIGRLPLSKGAREKDVNLLRVEEEARQGNLGLTEQNQMLANDESISQGAREILQHLKGNTNADSKTILAGTVEDFQQAGTKTKALSTRLYRDRDTALSTAIANREMVGPSLGKYLSEVVNAPENQAAFKSQAGGAARQLYRDFKSLMAKPEKEVPMVDLVAWMQDANALKKADDGPAGVMAGRLSAAMDDWLETGFEQKMMLAGDADVSQKIKAASAAYRQYKTLYTSENTNLIEGMVRPYDKTPADFVDNVFGRSLSGTNNTALVVRKMKNALPVVEQPQFTDNVFKGLVSRVFENAGDADNLSLAKLRNGLSDLAEGDTFKEHLSTPERKTIISNLIADLDQHIRQTGRRDVISPSGGAIMRGLNKLVGIPSDIPLVKHAPGVKAASEIVGKIAELDQRRIDRNTFQSAVKNAASIARQSAKSTPVYNPDAMKMGILGYSMTSTQLNKPNSSIGKR
jgi:hypothetical protein